MESRMNRVHQSPWLAAVWLASFLAAGCAANGAKVKGRLAVSGQAYPMAQGEEVQIEFASSTISVPVKSNADGMFTVTGPGGRGLPPGTYQIRLWSSGANVPPDKRYKDKFAGAYSGDQPWLQYEITSEPEQKIVIDLGTKTVVKE